MYQSKVNNTKKYSDSQGEHIVHLGKLILIDVSFIVESNYIHLTSPTGERTVKPIIISETEDIEVGDWYYWGNTKAIRKCTGTERDDSCYKIIALPEHFSENHLQAIVGGKMKEGEVLVKCKYVNAQIKTTHSKTSVRGEFIIEYIIDLDQQNNITLFPVKQSLEEAAKKFYADEFDDYVELKYYQYNKRVLNIFKAGAEWAKNNNYKGK